MSEKRRADFIIHVQRGRKGTGKLEIFRKSQWTGIPADRFFYRIRWNNKWQNGTHSTRRYVTRDEVMTMVLQELGKENIL
jgi:hypothetical protein